MIEILEGQIRFYPTGTPTYLDTQKPVVCLETKLRAVDGYELIDRIPCDLRFKDLLGELRSLPIVLGYNEESDEGDIVTLVVMVTDEG